MYLRAENRTGMDTTTTPFDCWTQELIVDCKRDEMTNAFPVELVRENEIGSTL